MLVQVSKEDIDNGIRCEEASCPIAHAINRATGKRSLVSDSLDIMLYDDGSTTYEEATHFVEIPKDKQGVIDNFIMDFDNCNPVEPFEFECEIKEFE